MGATATAVAEFFASDAAVATAATATAETAATAATATAATAASAGSIGSSLMTGLEIGTGLSVAQSLLAPKTPGAPAMQPVTPMPDPLAQQEAERQKTIEQLARRGRAASILTSPGGSDTLGG